MYHRTFQLCYLHHIHLSVSPQVICRVKRLREWGQQALALVGGHTLQPDSSSCLLLSTVITKLPAPAAFGRNSGCHSPYTVHSTVHCNSKKDEMEHVIRLSWLKQTKTAHRLCRSELCVSILLLGCEEAALWTTSKRRWDEWERTWRDVLLGNFLTKTGEVGEKTRGASLER